MRVALFHNLPSGGGKRAVQEWTRRLAPMHEIDVYTLSTADHAFCDIRPFVTAHREYPFSPARLFRSPFGRLNQLQRWRDLGRLARTGQHVARDIDTQKYDVVLAHSCQFTSTPLLLGFTGCPTVFYLHEPLVRSDDNAAGLAHRPSHSLRDEVDRIDPLMRLYRCRLEGLQARCAKATTRLLANSAFTGALTLGAYGVPSLVCPCGVDTERFRVLPDAVKGGHVLSVGELSARKGFAFLVEALGAIPAAQRPALRLACNVVLDAERRRVEALAAALGVELAILQGLGTADLVREYNAAALCVYAPIREPFGLVALESMACGTPLVAVAEGGFQECMLHQQHGLLVSRDAAEFAGAVASLLSTPALAREYGANARAHVERHWTWQRSSDALNRHLEEVAGGRASTGP